MHEQDGVKSSDIKDLIDETGKWGRQVDLAGMEYFSVVIDPVDAVEYTVGGICGLMQMPVDQLTETLFEHQNEIPWFRPMYVLWGQAVSVYDDDDLAGIRCTIMGYR